MHELDKQLHEMKQAMMRRTHLLARMNTLLDQRDVLREKEQRLFEKLSKEEADVEKMEGGSLRKYMCYIMGNYDEKLDIEKQEAHEARVRYDAVCKELDALMADVEKTDAELDTLADCEAEYQRLLREKTARIHAVDAAHSQMIVELDETLQTLEGQKRELSEAIAAGERAMQAAKAVEAELNSASEWGFWDMLGGGLLVDMAKHSHLDAAQTRVEQLQVHLGRFRTELADVAVNADVQIQMDSFLHFADFFFDGIFADWAVMDHIENSQKQIRNVTRQVGEVLQTLEAMLQENETTLADIQAQRDTLIVEY